MTAEEYVRRELEAGRLTAEHIVELTLCFQEYHEKLIADGKPGPATRAEIEKDIRRRAPQSTPFTLGNPLPTLPDGRKAVVTSGFKTVNPSRPNHNGCDLFYPWKEGDKPDFVGDGGAASKHPVTGKPRWVIPYGVHALAAADGVIQIAGTITTGRRCWVDHGNGWRTGYFHLSSLLVGVGDRVVRGQPLGLVGDNPRDGDARHLHFELSPADRYDPVDPEKLLKL